MIFGAWRDESAHESGALKASASEMLGLYSLFRHWVEHVLEDDMLALERDSFAKACRCVDIILDAKRRLTPMGTSGQALRRALSDYVEAHKRAYQSGHIKPKLHWMLHEIMRMIYLQRKCNSNII